MYIDLPNLKSNLIGGVDRIFESLEPVHKRRYYYKLWLLGDRYGQGIPLGSLRKGGSSYDSELKALVIDKITRENAGPCHDTDHTRCKDFPFTSNLRSEFPFWYRKKPIFLNKNDGTFVYFHSHYHLVMWLLSISCIFILSFYIYGSDHKLWISIWLLTILLILGARKSVGNRIYDKENKQLRYKKLAIDFNDIQEIIILSFYTSSRPASMYHGVLLSVKLKNGKTELINSFSPSETYAVECYICGLSYIAGKDFHIDAISDDLFDA
jgi:hypothetical protein